MDIEKYRRQDSSIVSDKDRIIYKEVLLACEHGIYIEGRMFLLGLQ